MFVADRYAPTSQCCSACGHQHKALRLHHRHWACPACGTQHDRDINAAANIITFATGGSPGSGLAEARPMRVEGETPGSGARTAPAARSPAKRESTHAASAVRAAGAA